MTVYRGNTNNVHCWRSVMSRCLFMTSSIFSIITGLSNAQVGVASSNGSAANANYSIVQTHTNGCESCSPSKDDDSPVGAIIGAAIVGAIVGASVTAAIMCYLKKRSLSPPPKDYGESGGQERLDVNRNNDEALLTNGGDKGNEEESGNNKSTTRVHKKLERLVHKDLSDKPVDLEMEMAAVPLIHNTDTSGDVSSAHTPTGSPGAREDNFSRYTPNPTVASPGSTPAEYLNWGERGPLEQPYDQLAIVPEEVEYENLTQNDYQAITHGGDTTPMA